jgi:hypothetical protein
VGLNFVAYAEDAVSDLYWTELNGAQTDASKCLNAIGGNPTTAELKLIWNSTWSGTPPVPTDANSQETTWANVFGTPCSAETSPIYPYWAQNGSGTESTWASATGAGFLREVQQGVHVDHLDRNAVDRQVHEPALRRYVDVDSDRR